MTLHHTTKGNSENTIIILHGLMGSVENWRPIGAMRFGVFSRKGAEAEGVDRD